MSCSPSFLTALSTWHKQELDEKLASRVQVSQRAVAKIIQVNLGMMLFVFVFLLSFRSHDNESFCSQS